MVIVIIINIIIIIIIIIIVIHYFILASVLTAILRGALGVSYQNDDFRALGPTPSSPYGSLLTSFFRVTIASCGMECLNFRQPFITAICVVPAPDREAPSSPAGLTSWLGPWWWHPTSSGSEPGQWFSSDAGTRPTNDIWIDFEIRQKYSLLVWNVLFRPQWNSTRHDGVTVVTCKKLCCDRLRIF